MMFEELEMRAEDRVTVYAIIPGRENRPYDEAIGEFCIRSAGRELSKLALVGTDDGRESWFRNSEIFATPRALREIVEVAETIAAGPVSLEVLRARQASGDPVFARMATAPDSSAIFAFFVRELHHSGQALLEVDEKPPARLYWVPLEMIFGAPDLVDRECFPVDDPPSDAGDDDSAWEGPPTPPEPFPRHVVDAVQAAPELAAAIAAEKPPAASLADLVAGDVAGYCDRFPSYEEYSAKAAAAIASHLKRPTPTTDEIDDAVARITGIGSRGRSPLGAYQAAWTLALAFLELRRQANAAATRSGRPGFMADRADVPILDQDGVGSSWSLSSVQAVEYAKRLKPLASVATGRDKSGSSPETSSRRRSVYVASSWRNRLHFRVVAILRACGFDVYDFKNPPGGEAFEWKAVNPAWQQWTADGWRRGLAHEVAQRGFARDVGGMAAADVCVLLLPAGRSAHLEAGWLAGRDVPVFTLAPEDYGDPDLMSLLLGPPENICADVGELLERLEVEPDRAAALRELAGGVWPD